MTLDVLQFIDSKGGNAEEIRESQRKRGLSTEIVDEVIKMYGDWVTSTFILMVASKLAMLCYTHASESNRTLFCVRVCGV